MTDARDAVRARIQQTVPLSPSAQRLLMVTAEEGHALRDVGRIVECDSVLTAYVIRIANTAAFKPKNDVATVSMAIALMGERAVIGTALDLCAKNIFQAPLEGYCGAPGGLWKHSLLAGLAAREIAHKARSPMEEGVAFTAGILHDIGKSVLSSFLKDKAGELMANLEKEGVSYLEVERELLGLDHCEAGAALGEHWRMPEPLITAIRYHHEPAKAPEPHITLAYAAHLGDIVAMMIGVADGSDGMCYKMDPGYVERFQLDVDGVETVMSSVLTAFEKMQSAMGYA